MKNLFYMYHCRTGCGEVTLIKRKFKQKRAFCGNCGEKSEMVYVGDYKIEQQLKLGILNK